MELYREILAHYLSKQNAQIIFPDLQINADAIIQQQCYQALCKIKTIIQDENLEDTECFMQIEQIICALEDIGVSGESRHDFG